MLPTNLRADSSGCPLQGLPLDQEASTGASLPCGGRVEKIHHQPVDRIAKDTQFGNVSLLDGSAGTNAVTNGANLQFIGASEKSQGSGVNGYGVTITHASARAEHDWCQAAEPVGY